MKSLVVPCREVNLFANFHLAEPEPGFRKVAATSYRVFPCCRTVTLLSVDFIEIRNTGCGMGKLSCSFCVYRPKDRGDEAQPHWSYNSIWAASLQGLSARCAVHHKAQHEAFAGKRMHRTVCSAGATGAAALRMKHR